ncbi:MAG: DsbA family protein [Planktotalea sp.]|uniref:DsbA family protein n=1 Tax=Planktotalea sp. TaxID=2029877 RepID=UPI003C787FEE
MKRLLATTSLCIAALGAPAQAFDLTAMSAPERESFRAEVRAFLMENPEVIIEAVNQMEARQAAQQEQDDLSLVSTNADALFNDGYSWVGGNPEGDVTVVEFLDYRCGYCRKAHSEVEQLLQSDGNIRLIVKEFPILGEASTASSRFAIATRHVAGDAAYKAVHDALIAFSGEPSSAALARLADGLGLDADAIVAKMDSDEVTREIDETRALAQRLQIRGTPTFVMGGQLVRGYVPLDAMQQIVDQERG